VDEKGALWATDVEDGIGDTSRSGSGCSVTPALFTFFLTCIFEVGEIALEKPNAGEKFMLGFKLTSSSS
jgi:hypothetical protein